MNWLTDSDETLWFKLCNESWDMQYISTYISADADSVK
jgi:hypothetical protein